MSRRVKFIFFILFISIVSLSCRLTSATPAAWINTTTAESRSGTNEAYLLTQEAAPEFDIDLTPIPSRTEVMSTTTPTPEIEADGPWLVYLAPGGDGIHAYDLDARTILSISLPSPVYKTDLTRGLSPDGHSLVLRAGSPLNFDELALYQIDLPSTNPTPISPLMSLSLQREIVNEGSNRAFETFKAVTLDPGIAWSPSGRFLAFNAALDNESSDLYLFDTLNNRVERLNGLYTQNTSPFWSPASNWLVTQELGDFDEEIGWRSENVSGIEVPGFDNQNSIYLPMTGSEKEVFVGWVNPQSFISYSQTSRGFQTIKQANLETFETAIIFDGYFNQAAFDPESKVLAFTIDNIFASLQGLAAGVYMVQPESQVYLLAQAGDWENLYWDQSGRFGVSGSQGVLSFSDLGEHTLIPGEDYVLQSPDGSWMLAWSGADGEAPGLRLYQPDSDRPLQTIINSPVQNAIWAPDSKSFFIHSEDFMYVIQFPSLNVLEIENGFSPEELVEWVWVE